MCREPCRPFPTSQRVPLIMSPVAASALTALAEDNGGNHPSLSPYLTGFGALGALLLLLWLVTRFNRD
jgi:hypothetical protein